ncbi:MAG TPA: hypothetical protein PLV77_10585 [Solirubrobacterales bacterium]|nr:hypothetical protein [Solirubrobacterales bacterium]
MKRLIGVAVLGAALLLAGCGGDSDEDQAGEVVSNFAAALADGDYAAACEMYSPKTHEFFKDTSDVTGGCEPGIERVYSGLSHEKLEAYGDVEEVTIDGDKATVEQASGDYTILQKVDGEWMLTLDQ